jgi:hypothetical protein
MSGNPMIYFVDFEASSLEKGSFPIEIAWVDQNGHGETYLIRPAEGWLTPGNPEWSAASERIHGISLTSLLDGGGACDRIAKRAAEALGSIQVIACSDAPAFDGHWLEMLLVAGGQRRQVRLLDVQQIYGWACRPLLELLPLGDGPGRDRAEERVRNLAREIIAQAEEEEAMQPRVHHRALPDAESLWRTWQSVREKVALHLAEEGR